MKKHSLLRDLPAAAPAESFETIAKTTELTLERIVSRGQATPAGEWLCQERDEWVCLIEGAARLVFEGGEPFDMGPGEYVRIPAGTRHRVEWTGPDRPTVWLALHYSSGKDNAEQDEGIRQVKIMRSSRRRRTCGARLYGGTMYVYVPKNMAEKEVRAMADTFTKRFEKSLLRKKLNSSKGLRQVAEELNAKYFRGMLAIDSIQYVTDQSSKFGCCNYSTRSIRISHKIAAMPGWVRDYVVMHEICHLREPDHGPAFWALVAKYPLAERAKGYLLAKGLEPDEE